MNYVYDTSNNLSKQTQAFENIEKIYEYNFDRAGRLNNFKLDNLMKLYNYDSYSRLDNVVLRSGYYERYTYYKYLSVGGNCYSNLVEEVIDEGNSIVYNYDGNRNIISVTENDEFIYEYEYDEFNQLTKEHNRILNITIAYVYDAYGNILSKSEYEYKTLNLLKTINYTYDSEWKDLITSYNGKAIITDNVGNLKTYDGKTYNWINGRELASIIDENNIYTYTYNDDGIRTSKTINGQLTTYELYNNQVVYEKTGDIIIYYIYDAYNDIIGFEYNGHKYYYRKNLQQDVLGILNASLEEVVTYTYDSWGNLISVKDSEGVEVTSDSHIGHINPYRYRSYRYDKETGLYYLQARYYNPEWGRFISADNYLTTGQDNQGNNMFVYCLNNPINYTDANGNLPQWFKSVVKIVLNTVASIIADKVPNKTIEKASNVASFLGLKCASETLNHSLKEASEDLYYDKNSKISKKLANSKAIKKAKNESKSDVNFGFNEPDLFLAIGTVAFKTESVAGNVETITIVDIYDFELEPYNFSTPKATAYSIVNFINNIAYYKQQNGTLNNYNIYIEFEYIN